VVCEKEIIYQEALS